MSGEIHLVPSGAARNALEDDYLKMHEANIIHSKYVPFDTLMDRLSNLENRINRVLGQVADKDDKPVKSDTENNPDDPSI